MANRWMHLRCTEYTTFYFTLGLPLSDSKDLRTSLLSAFILCVFTHQRQLHAKRTRKFAATLHSDTLLKLFKIIHHANGYQSCKRKGRPVSSAVCLSSNATPKLRARENHNSKITVQIDRIMRPRAWGYWLRYHRPFS